MAEREVIAQAIFDQVRLWSMPQCLDLADAVLRRLAPAEPTRRLHLVAPVLPNSGAST